MKNYIHAIPKAELHLHIEGTLEPEMKFELAKRNNIKLPYKTRQEIIDSYNFTDLPSFLKIYYEGMNVLITEEDFYDLTYAYLKRARKENIVYVEMFFDPQAHTCRGVSFDTVINGIHRAQEDGLKYLGIRSNLIMCILRDADVDYSMATLLQALNYKDWIIGIGLDSNEYDNPPIKFKHIFERARSEGFFLTMHCDVDIKNTTEHIRQVLDEIKVDRIDHGVNSLQDDYLWQEIKKRGLGLTVCPVSNGFVTDNNKSLEIKEMLDKEMNVTVNSDDPAYFLGYMEKNIQAVYEEANLTKENIRQLIENSFKVSFLSKEEKQWYIELLNSY